MVMMDAKESIFTSLLYEKIKIDNAMDTAIDDTMTLLVEQDSKNNITLNHKRAISMFYHSLIANLGIQDDKEKCHLLKIYFPVISVMDIDGFYIQYKKIEQGNIIDCWTEKFPYCSCENNNIYQFFIGNEKNNLRIVSNNRVYTGSVTELQEQVAISDQVKYNFEQYRRDTIIRCVKEKMQYYIDQNNNIAKEFGIEYEFYLPNIARDDWVRSMDDISMFVLFQGYPYQAIGHRYNRYTLSGARTHKEDKYYIQWNGEKKLYHKFHCKQLKEYSDSYMTKKECAKAGAFTCPECKP